MANTPRMQWPFPSKNKREWYEALEDFSLAQDASGYASREDRNIKLTKGGTVSFDAGTGVMTWDESIEIPVPISGFLWILPAASATLTNGQFAYVVLPRRPLSNRTLTLQVASQVPSTDDTIVLFFRKDDRIYFREGQVLLSGESKSVLSESGGGGGGVPALPEANIFIGDNTATAQAQPMSGDVGISASGLTSLANGVVSTLKLQDLNVTNAKIANSTIQGSKLDTTSSFDWSANPEKLITGSASLAAEVTNLDTVTKQSRKMRKIVGFKQTSGLVPLLLTEDLLPFSAAHYSGMTPVPTINIVYILHRAGGAHSVGAYLYDVSNGEIITSSVVSGIVAGLPSVSRAPLNLGGGAGEMKAAETIYEVRLTNTGTTAPELANLGSAYLEFIY